MSILHKILKTFVILSFFIFFILLVDSSVFAQSANEQINPEFQKQQEVQLSTEETLEGNVVKILEEKQIVPIGVEKSQLYQKLEILITKGSLKNKKITVENGNLPMSNLQKYNINDNIIITHTKNFEGKDVFYITDYVRRNTLLWLFMLFALLACIIGRWQGLTSLIGMGISFLVIFLFILPKISSGNDPVQIAILGSLIIIPTTFFLSHGINKKTIIAIMGTLIALVITGVLAGIFVEAAKLTGFASEEVNFLQAYKPGIINIKGLLLAGIIIGILGILDDITISQSAIVQQLKLANPKLKDAELYKKAMAVGKDHIASMINTLILVYAGTALPLLIIFINNSHPFSEIINYEIIAEEVIRALVGSIGLILAVPITTMIAIIMVTVTERR